MTTLTTRERDIIKILLDADEPIGMGDLASTVQLTARQVNYSMKGVKRWLKHRDVLLQTKPGVGVMINCVPAQRKTIFRELENNQQLQLALTPGQRQQLICFMLLVENQPVILTQIRAWLKVSRTTIINDLETVEAWFKQWGLVLERKQNYGIWIASSEKERQQVLLALFWGEAPFGPSLFEISFQNGLKFSLCEDTGYLPLVQQVCNFLELFDIKKIFNKVVFIEDFLGGRFTDDSVLYLALVLSILVARVKMGNHIEAGQGKEQLGKKPVWEAATKMIRSLEDRQDLAWQDGDIAYVAMHILSSPRNESWINEFDQEHLYTYLSNELLTEISRAYNIVDLKDDPILREGIINHLIPVCNQHIYHLWFPKTQADILPEDEYSKEHNVAERLIQIIRKHTSIQLLAEEVNVIAMLLRAAYIRLQPHHFQQVLVVCPSGMATAQLLTARLSTRFPRLGKLSVVSFRELDASRIRNADLIITLMSLPKDLIKDKPTIQVSPQLLPEDIEAITAFLG